MHHNETLPTDETTNLVGSTADLMKLMSTSHGKQYTPHIVNGMEISRTYQHDTESTSTSSHLNSMQPDYAAIQKAMATEPLPAIAIDEDAFNSNLNLLSNAVSGTGKTIRIATKSIRVPELILQASTKPGFKGVMSYSAAEAQLLYDLGVDDILIAYPTAQSSDLKILRELAEKNAQIAIVVDCEEHMKLIQQAMLGSDKQLRVLIDMDMSLRYLNGLVHLGVRRSPIHSDQDLRNILRLSHQYPAVKVIGAMAYEATVAGVQDRNPFSNTIINWIKSIVRKLSAQDVAVRRARVPDIFQSEGFTLDIFNGGGTGSFNFALQEKALTEVTVGSGILNSHLFDYYSNLQDDQRLHFKPGIFAALSCDRSSDAQYATVRMGGQLIASGVTDKDRYPLPVYPEGLKIDSMEGPGEVQTPLTVVNKNVPFTLKIGDPVLFRPAKAGEPAECVNQYAVVSHGEITAHMQTYRGLGRP